MTKLCTILTTPATRFWIGAALIALAIANAAAGNWIAAAGLFGLGLWF